MNLKKNGKVLTSKSVGSGPSSYEKSIYRAAVSQGLRNADVENQFFLSDCKETWTLSTDIRRILCWELIIKHPHHINLVPETAVLM